MPKKDELQTAQKAEIKKSKSAEELKPSSEKQDTLQAENTDLRIQLAELTRAFDQAKKIWEQENNALTDQNNELRLQHLKDSDALKASQQNEEKYFQASQQSQKQISQLQSQLTKTHQDLKQAQRIIELRLNNEEKPINQPNYWKWLSLTLAGIVLWFWLKGASQ
jgi:hypothetical protein